MSAETRLALIADTLGREPRDVVWVEEGYDFLVALVDSEWAFRFPRRAEPARALELEIELLPALAPALPVPVPRFEHVVREPELFVAYPLIEAEPLRDEDPGGVAAFLSALHRFDADGLPVPRPDWRAAFAEQCERFRGTVAPLLDADERRRAERLFAEVETLTGFQPALVHGDLGRDHLRCRDGRLVGVIDWGDARMGDPALDYSWLIHVPFPDWDVDADLRRRALFHHRLAPWFEADYGLFTGRPDRVEAGLRGVRARLP